MPAVVSLLRGVNVGGNRLIKMDALRAIYESLGLTQVQTYVQSGNVIFSSPARDIARLPERIAKAIEQAVGFHVDIVIRTAAELRDVVSRNPFAGRREIEPNKLHVMFLAAVPSPQASAKVLALPSTPEELRLDGRELYIHYPDGMGKSKLSSAVLDRALQVPGTVRNWNSVTKLLEMAEALEQHPPKP